MPKKVLIPLLILVTLLFAGCPKQEEPPKPKETKEKVTLYFGDEKNESLKKEEREITLKEGEDKYKVTLEELIRGPETESYTENIPPETKVYGTIKQEDALLVNLSEEFQQFGGSVAETVAVLSIVNTLTEFEEIKRVKILVEGEELIGPSGEPRGFMEKVSQEAPPEATVELVILYFAKPDASALVPEERNITVTTDTGLTEMLELVLDELIMGPNKEGLSPTIPKEVKVNSLEMREKTAVVDFSEEMHTKHPGGAAAETMTILSIVNTLTEFAAVDLVKMTVDGEPMNIEHVVLDAPVERNEVLIEPPKE